MPITHALLLVVLLGMPWIVDPLRSWPWGLLGPLAIFYSIAALVKPLRRTMARPSLGTFSRPVLIQIAAISSTTSLILVSWNAGFQPDLHLYAQQPPAWPTGHWLWRAVAFALVNSTLEELIFRGVFFDALIAELGTTKGVFAQAVVFGIVHFHGVPSGVLGTILAGMYGLFLGWLRQQSSGLGPPIVAHFFADVTIFYLIIQSPVG